MESLKVGKNTTQNESKIWIPHKVIQGEYSEPSQDRRVFTSYIKGLEKNQTYLFRIEEASWKSPSTKLFSYYMPTENLTIIMGGDVGNTKISYKMNKDVVSPLQPDLIMIGGDISYDNSIPECYMAWDYLLKSLPILIKDEKSEFSRIIPIIFGVGNHDFGVIAGMKIKITHDKTQPVLKHFFPQNSFEGGIPTLKNRHSYFAHRFGSDLLILSLDTGYEKSMDSEQTEWLRKELESQNYKIKIAQYHSPIYPSCFPNRDLIVQKQGKENWAPLFEKYNFTIVSENHSHYFKRSKSIKNKEVNSNGITYIGEGSWGVLRD